ncbi:hypothetical protein [Paracoccus sp. MC1862]|nr:hypothetical protein [Paracoccus sp. MC1862]
MMRKVVILAALAASLAGCGEQPIRKTNCWSSMSFVTSANCR